MNGAGFIAAADQSGLNRYIIKPPDLLAHPTIRLLDYQTTQLPHYRTIPATLVYAPFLRYNLRLLLFE
jgi:hypothetical protein